MMAFELAKLPYAYSALEPHIDARTMEIHHTKHHQAYITNLNNAIAGTDAEKLSIEEICKNISKYPVAVRNNGGGHYNHSLFWSILSGSPSSPSEKLLQAINTDLGGMEKLKEEFNKAAATRFGSGWAWLCVQDGKLKICSTPNQDNPLMDIAECKATPILGLDVWEHAYYLHYQNRRPDYCAAFWNIINWTEVSRRYESAL
ncbi:MAG: superoxide dismutase [Bacteroidia bacterium]|nr:superoxide dismutase [Bacteroidia bacterium]MCC7533638.1 superoxide dismutase [Bacteroidia bacterium]